MSQEPSHTAAGAAVTNLILEVFRLNGRLLAAGERLAGPLGLTSARWQVLGAVAMASTPEPVARLARNMGVHRQGVQRLVDALAAEGWVKFTPNPHHRRAKLVELTAAGASIYDKVARLQIPWANALAEDIDVVKLEETVRLMASLRARLTMSDPLDPDHADEMPDQKARS